METYIKIMQRYYDEKLEELRETLGNLPSEIPEELARIIINPQGQSETEFCVKSIDFLNETTSFFDDIASEMKANNVSEKIIRNWENNLNWFTSYHSFHHKQRIIQLNRLLELRPQLVNELTTWAKDYLTKYLTMPETEEELNLCRSYTLYLDKKASFLEDKKRYLERLKGLKRQKTITELEKTPKNQGILEILKEPETEEELRFCKSYFALQDDLYFLEEAAKEGRVLPIDIEDSETLNSVAAHIEFRNISSFFQCENSLGHAYYQLKALENTNYEGMINSIAKRISSFAYPEVAYYKVISDIENNMIEGIERGCSRKDDCIDRFISIQEAFNYAYRQGITYETLTSTKTQRGNALVKKLI